MSAPDFPIVIYHNPGCGCSRNTLAMIRAAGFEPEVIEYLKVGWDRSRLRRLAVDTGLGVRGLLRDKEARAMDPGLLEPDVAEANLLDAMAAEPILVNRPIVVTPKGARLCRPPETVMALLETAPGGSRT